MKPQLRQKLSDAFDGSKNTLLLLLEVALVVAWALFISRPYLDFSPVIWPGGDEYVMSQQNNYNLHMLAECGTCMFWNGSTNGGVPTFVDLHGATFHPVTILATYLLDAFNGGKLVFILSLIMAGLAQLWLGRQLKLGFLARVWGALLVVAGGHLAGKMSTASVPLVLSTAACSLVIPAAWQLVAHWNKKNAVLTGLLLGLALLAGQGYMQVGLFIALVPAIGYLLIAKRQEETEKKPLWREAAIVLGLALLVAAVLLVPLLHNAGFLEKDVDPVFDAAQPIKYSLLNLVIDDEAFYRTEILGKLGYPYLYVNYIGWIPLLLAVVGLVLAHRKYRRVFISFGLAIGFLYLFSSGLVLSWIASLPFSEITNLVAGLRNPSLIQGLVIPFLAGFAAIGLDALVRRPWSKYTLAQEGKEQGANRVVVPVKWILLLAAMVLSLRSAALFTRSYVWTFKEDGVKLRAELAALKTNEAEWVEPPFGEYYWLPDALNAQMKIAAFFRPWSVIDAELPSAYLELDRDVAYFSSQPGFVGVVDDLALVAHPDAPYAYLANGEQKTPCSAVARGGNIDVSCSSASGGILTVLERNLPGWKAWQEDSRTELFDGTWLSVAAPAGEHTFHFRYLPWDVFLGLLLSAAGWGLAIFLLVKYRKQPQE